MTDNSYSARFDGPVEHVVVGDHNTVIIQYVGGHQRHIPFLAPPRPAYGLVGRRDILASLRNKLVAHENAGLIALEGQPGIGKTALAIDVANDHQILERFSDGVLWSGLGKSGAVLLELARWGAALGVSEQDLEKSRTVEARAHLVHSAIGLKRMLLVIDDVWKTEDALALKLGGPHCVHIVTSRFPRLAESFAGANVLPVPELDEKQARELLWHFVGDLRVGLDDQARTLLGKTGGLPLLIVLLGVYLRAEGRQGNDRRLERALNAVFNQSVRLQLSYPVGPLEQHPSLPAGSRISLQAIIGISVDDLTATEKACFRSLALFPAKPNTFSENAAVHVSGQNQDMLEELVDRRLVENPRAGRYSLHQSLWDFASQFPPDEVYESRFVAFFLDSLDAAPRSGSELSLETANIHQALDIVRRKNPERFERGVLQYTRYLFQTGAYQTAAEYLRDAESMAKTRGASDERQAMLLAGLGAVLFRLGAYDEAEETLRSALERAAAPTMISGVFGDLGSLAERRGQYQQAESWFEKGMELAAEREDHAALASLLTEAAWVSVSRGNYSVAESRLSDAYAHAQTAIRPDLISGALNNWGWAKIKRGELRQADDLLEHGLRIAKAINFQERISGLLINLGVSAEKQGNYAKAEQWFQQSLAIAERLGSPEKLSAILTNLGLLAEYRGAFAQAEEYDLRALSFARTLKHQERISNLLQNLGSVAAYTGRFENALLLNREALSLAKAIQHPERVVSILQERASIFLLTNHLFEADDVLREAIAIVEGLGNRERWATLRGYMAELATKRGDHDSALDLLVAAEEVIGAMGHIRQTIVLLIIRGETELAKHGHFDANQAFQKASTLAIELGTIPTVAEAYFGLARCALDAGDRDKAITDGSRAQQLFTQIGHFKADVVTRWLADI